jgi:regulatory protein YycI of two-component signal transduction system YycFG
LKIDGLKDNLNCYEKNIDLTLKEIPKDIRSMNNSNFNNSSSRYQNQETDRNSKLLKTNRQLDGGMVIPDDLSEETLKTILDFHSDRAQT